MIKQRPRFLPQTTWYRLFLPGLGHNALRFSTNFAIKVSFLIKPCPLIIISARSLDHVSLSLEGLLSRLLSKAILEMIIYAFINARLDYANAFCTCTNKFFLNSLKTIQNASSRLVTRSHKRCPIDPVLFSRYWLMIEFWVRLKELFLTLATGTWLPWIVKSTCYSTANCLIFCFYLMCTDQLLKCWEIFWVKYLFFNFKLDFAELFGLYGK